MHGSKGEPRDEVNGDDVIVVRTVDKSVGM